MLVLLLCKCSRDTFLTGEAKPRKSLVVGQSGVSNSVSKLLLAASASKGRLIVITWHFMFAVEVTSEFELLHGSHWWFSRPLVQDANSNKVSCMFSLSSLFMVRRKLHAIS